MLCWTKPNVPNKPPYNPVNLQSPTDHCSSLELDLQIRMERLQAGLETRGSVRHSNPVATRLHMGKGTAQNQTPRPHLQHRAGRLYQLTVLVWGSWHYGPIAPVEVAADRKK